MRNVRKIDYVSNGTFKQTDTPGRWKDAEGVVHRMADMDSSYIVNCMYICNARGKYNKWKEFFEELRSRGDDDMPSFWIELKKEMTNE